MAGRAGSLPPRTPNQCLAESTLRGIVEVDEWVPPDGKVVAVSFRNLAIGNLVIQSVFQNFVLSNRIP
jgi:hypothetical protein